MPRTMEEASVSWSKGRPVGSRWRATAIPSTRSEWRADFSAYPGILHPGAGPAERSRGRLRTARAAPPSRRAAQESSGSGQRPRDFELTQREPRKAARNGHESPANIDHSGKTPRYLQIRPKTTACRRTASAGGSAARRAGTRQGRRDGVSSAPGKPKSCTLTRRNAAVAGTRGQQPLAGRWGEAGTSGAPGTKDTENLRAILEPDPLAGVRQPASRSTPDRGALALRHRIRLARRAGPADFHAFPFPLLRGSHGQ